MTTHVHTEQSPSAGMTWLAGLKESLGRNRSNWGWTELHAVLGSSQVKAADLSALVCIPLGSHFTQTQRPEGTANKMGGKQLKYEAQILAIHQSW